MSSDPEFDVVWERDGRRVVERAPTARVIAAYFFEQGKKCGHSNALKPINDMAAYVDSISSVDERAARYL